MRKAEGELERLLCNTDLGRLQGCLQRAALPVKKYLGQIEHRIVRVTKRNHS